MSTEECKLERTDPLHTPLPSHTYTKWLQHTYTPSLLISPAALRRGLPDPVQCVCAYVQCACYVQTGTEQQAELRLCDQIWNGRESHSSSCSPALRGSHSDRGQSQGHRHRGLPLLPLPFAYSADWYWVICTVKTITADWVLCLCVYEFPILSGARMRMRELSLRQDPDLRKELALLARGCDFVLPSRFKKRLRAFQQGQAGVCMSIPLPHWLCWPVGQWAVLNYCNCPCYSSLFGTIGVEGACCILGRLGQVSSYITFSGHILKLRSNGLHTVMCYMNCDSC